MTLKGMNPDEWLVREWSERLAESIQAMTEERPSPRVMPSSEAPPEGLAWYVSAISVSPDAAVWVGAAVTTWRSIGRFALAAAGLDDATDEDSVSTTLEILQQATSSVVRTLSTELGKEITCETPKPAPVAPIQVAALVEISLGAASLTIYFASANILEPDAAANRASRPGAASDTPALTPLVHGNSKTLDLLMEVELPVAVSFGRAVLPLKDVLKLNSGSIVELNRTIAEPVEIIVNNCVIARGEVVVVDGNYGVRIEHVVSRDERLRTLN